MTIDADIKMAAPQRRTRIRLIVGACIAVGLAVFVAANVHLVYVSVTSQPDCVAHAKETGSGPARTVYRAARSSC
ncbi:hypothetical protein [Borborobacter arsenicus]|nr:hypothetical protein [Pseudaminobacter arsenicus]